MILNRRSFFGIIAGLTFDSEKLPWTKLISVPENREVTIISVRDFRIPPVTTSHAMTLENPLTI